MITVRNAIEPDIEFIKNIDHLMSSECEREVAIKNAINNNSAYVVCYDETVAGYGIIHHHFFGHPFIEMVYISEDCRGNGYGPILMNAMLSNINSSKVFTSTNQSNEHMQHVLKRDGWIKSGYIDHLDEGDPEIIYIIKLS